MCIARHLLCLWIAVASVSCATSRETEKHWLPLHAETEQPPLFALWSEPPNNVYLVGTKLPGLVVAAWSDGRVVFSKDVKIGGSPFAEKRVSTADLLSIRDRALDAIGGSSGYAIPDAGGSELFIREANGSRTIYAVHELMPDWTPYGRESKYRSFVAHWTEATALLRGLTDPRAPNSDRELFRFENVALP